MAVQAKVMILPEHEPSAVRPRQNSDSLSARAHLNNDIKLVDVKMFVSLNSYCTKTRFMETLNLTKWGPP